jgi:hypothetical protein
MKQTFYLILLIAIFCKKSIAQLGPTGPNDTITVTVFKINETDSFALFKGDDATITAKLTPKEIEALKKKKALLERFVRETYCMAKDAAATYNNIKVTKQKLKKRKDKKKLLKESEKQLKELYAHKIKNMYRGTGDVLIKLISRETGESAYEIIKETKGGINARFWQTLMQLNKGSLNQKYEPEGKDALLESIVLRLEKEIICNNNIQ